MSWKTLMQLTIYSGMDRRKQAKHSNRSLEESRKPHQRLDLCLYQLPGGREIKHHHGNNRIVCVVNHLLCLEVNVDMGFYCAFSIVLYKTTVITKCETNILTPTFPVIWQTKMIHQFYLEIEEWTFFAKTVLQLYYMYDIKVFICLLIHLSKLVIYHTRCLSIW